jgi:hypothetical protein
MIRPQIVGEPPMRQFVRDMPLIIFLLFTIVPAGAAVAFAVGGLRARRRAALIRETPTSNIGMATGGYSELEGRVEAAGGESLAAPLTRTPCVWYFARVERWTTDSDGDSSWRTIFKETSGAPFLLRDATGTCMVVPVGAGVTPTDKSEWHGSTAIPMNRTPARVRPGEEARATAEVSAGRDSKYRYYEERIYAGDPLLALGELNRLERYASNAEGEDDVDLDLDDVEDDDSIDEDDESPDPDARSVDQLGSLNEDVADRLWDAARSAASVVLSAGTGRRPFILTTQLQAIQMVHEETVSQVSFPMALAAALATGFLLWLRFG